MKDIHWFKKEIAPLLNNYEVKYDFVAEGEFGALDRVEFDSGSIKGSVEIWDSGWLGIFVYNYKVKKQLMNVFVEPDLEAEKEMAIADFKKMLG